MLDAHPSAARVHGALLARGREALPTRHGRFVLHRFLHLGRGETLLAATIGELAGDEPLLARVHSACVTSEVLGACDCDCAAQLQAALGEIAAEGRGVLFYPGQEGRGAGLVAKARDRMLVQASRERITTFEAYERLGLPHDPRGYDEIADMRALLGCSAPLLLLTNNPDKVSGLDRAKVPLAGVRPLVTEPSPFNQHYLAAKGRAGHELSAADARRAPLPRPVEARPPAHHARDPDWIRAAAYLIPVGPRTGEPPCWMEAQVWLDLRRGRPRLLLVGLDGPGPVGGWLGQRWADRFVEAPGPRAVLADWLGRLARDGVGCIGLLDPGESAPDGPSERLWRHPVTGP